MLYTNQELATTCPECNSPNIVQNLEAYILCLDCNWNEYEETFPIHEDKSLLSEITDFDDKCEHGVWIKNNCEECNLLFLL